MLAWSMHPKRRKKDNTDNNITLLLLITELLTVYDY